MTHPLIHALVEIGSEPGVPSEPEDNSTEAAIAAMMTENTGRHMLDSGGAYGRDWERNQGRDFASEPEVTVSWRHGWIDVTLNLYHFLVNSLDYLPELTEKFHEWSNQGEMKDESWFTCIEEFADQLKQAEDGDPEEPFASFLAVVGNNPCSGDSFREATWTVNTYNHDSLLSQVIQYSMVGDLVFLQVHGGADVRGGYTVPRVFHMLQDFPDLISDSRATIWCDSRDCHTVSFNFEVQSSWMTDDGYHWYLDGGSSDKQLETYETIEVNEPEGFGRWRARNIVREVLGDELVEEFPALRAYDSDEDISFCPICHEGKLVAGY